jgi:transglutaminase/protease-like cytokinesis protein 3
LTSDSIFSEKTTTVRSAEPLKLKSNVFAKGFKVEITWNLDPNNPIHLDQMMMKVEESNIKKAVLEFIKFNESLGYTHLRDDGK